MKKINKIAVIALASLFLSNGAFAEEKKSVYVGVGVYKTTSEEVAGFTEGGITVSDLKYDKANLKVLVGQKIDDNVAIEAQYFNFSKDDIGSASGPVDVNGVTTNVSVNLGEEGSSIGVAALVYLRNDSIAQPFVKLGLHRWDVDFTISAGGVTIPIADDKGTDLFYGVGADVTVSDDIDIRAEYESYEIEDEKYKAFGVAAIFKF